MKFPFPACLLLLLPLSVHAQDREEGFEKEHQEIRGIIYPNWERVIDALHPTYNEIKVMDDAPGARTGGSYLRFRTQGGNTSFQEYLRDATRVTPGQVYLVSAHTRIKPAEPGERPRTNTATVQLRWLGKRGEPLRIDRSIPVSGAADWKPLSLEVQTPPQGSEWVQVRLSYEGRDVRGECAFDDIMLEVRPRILVRPNDRTLPVFLPGEQPGFRIQIPSIRTSEAILDVTVRNQRGAMVVPTVSLSIQPGKEIPHRIPALRNSYQELHLQLRRGGKILARKVVPILVPEPSLYGSDTGGAIGLSFNPFHEKYTGIRELAGLLHLRNAKMVVWDHPAAQRSKEPTPAEILRMIRDASREAGTEFIGVLAQPLPSAFPGRTPGEIQGSPLILFQQEESIWAPVLKDNVRRYREVIRQWQVGLEEDPTASEIVGRDDALGTAVGVIRKIQKSAIVGTTLPAKEIRIAPMKNAQFYSVSTREWRSPREYETPPDPPDTIVYRTANLRAAPPLGGTPARRMQAADFLKKMIFNAAAGNPYPLYLPASSDPQGGILDSDGNPTATALAMRIANDLLAGSTFHRKNSLFVSPVRDFVFEKNGKWFVAFWSEEGSQSLQTFLGHKAQLWDPLGTRGPFRSSGGIRVDGLPLFIVDVDPYLLQTILTLRFHPDTPGAPADPTLPMRADPIPKRLRLTNHFPTAIVGVKVRIGRPLPLGWDARPLEMQAPRVEPETSIEKPLSFRLPQTEKEGIRKLWLTLTFEREDDPDRPFTITLERALQVVSRVFVTGEVTTTGNRKRVVVLIENKTGRQINLRGSLRVPGHPDRPLLIGPFPPNSDHLLDPVVVHSRTGFRGKSVEVRLQEMGGKRIFSNKVIPLFP